MSVSLKVEDKRSRRSSLRHGKDGRGSQCLTRTVSID